MDWQEEYDLTVRRTVRCTCRVRTLGSSPLSCPWTWCQAVTPANTARRIESQCLAWAGAIPRTRARASRERQTDVAHLKRIEIIRLLLRVMNSRSTRVDRDGFDGNELLMIGNSPRPGTSTLDMVYFVVASTPDDSCLLVIDSMSQEITVPSYQ